jgi:hypothetical protein
MHPTIQFSDAAEVAFRADTTAQNNSRALKEKQDKMAAVLESWDKLKLIIRVEESQSPCVFEVTNMFHSVHPTINTDYPKRNGDVFIIDVPRMDGVDPDKKYCGYTIFLWMDSRWA